MKTYFTTDFYPDGTVEVGPVAPEDWEAVRATVMPAVTAIAGDNAIVHGACLGPQRVEAIAQRLAERILAEGT